MNQNANSLGIFTESISIVACPSCNAELDVSEFQVFEEIECPSCKEKFQVPGRLGDFILIEELGRGAMGCVYLAMDESLKRLVALKVIRKEYGADPKMLETVQREAQAMATLNHRNIVQVYSFGRVKEQPYFVMELLEGERLDEMMANGNQVPEIRALEIALDVAQGLDAANQAGLTHGDIKPANILMNDHGVAKVVDFGLAKFMEPGAEIEVWGTPYYIAPEKARKKGEDSRSDQYSLGGTIFHALAGQPPFDGPNPTKVVVAALKEETPELHDYNPGVTDKTAAVVRRMMDKNPNRRYPTYASLLADLNLALGEAKMAEEERRLQEERLQMKQNKKMSPLIPIALLVTVMVCAGIGFVVYRQMQDAARPVIQPYEGEPRQHLQPFHRVELRNLNEAVTALSENNLTLAQEKIAVAERLIPEKHAAMGWLKFFEAGMYFYAQRPEKAQELLEEAASIEEMIFDTEKTPDEDPRILAKYALGDLEAKDLEKILRDADPYYDHMAELAKGYRQILEGRGNQSARNFRAYTEKNVQGMTWPYMLRPLAKFLHLPREKLISEKEKEEMLKARGTELLAGIGRRTSEGHPAFKSTFIQKDNTIQMDGIRSVRWEELRGNRISRISSGHMLVSAGGMQVLPDRAFTIAADIQTLPSSERKTGESDVLFHFGAFSDNSAGALSSGSPVKGVVVEVSPVTGGTPSLRIRIGDGEKNLLEQSLVANTLEPGRTQSFSVTWDGYRKDGSDPSFELRVAIDGEAVGTIDLKNGPFPDSAQFTNVAIGAGLAGGRSVGWGGRRLPVSKIVVFSEPLTSENLREMINSAL